MELSHIGFQLDQRNQKEQCLWIAIKSSELLATEYRRRRQVTRLVYSKFSNAEAQGKPQYNKPVHYCDIATPRMFPPAARGLENVWVQLMREEKYSLTFFSLMLINSLKSCTQTWLIKLPLNWRNKSHKNISAIQSEGLGKIYKHQKPTS